MNLKYDIIENSESRFHREQIAWADGVLSQPAVTYPNGRNSHEVAHEVREKSEDALIDHLCLRVTA